MSHTIRLTRLPDNTVSGPIDSPPCVKLSRQYAATDLRQDIVKLIGYYNQLL